MAAMATPASAATRGFTITSFDAIRVDAPIDVAITTGAGASARAEGDQALLDRLKVDVSGRLMAVTMERARPGERSGGRAVLRLSTGALQRIVLTGGGSVSVSRLKGLRGEIILGGNGDVAVGAVDVDQLNIGLAGAGRATLAGRAGVATMRVNGPGAVMAELLHARQASVSNDGPGNITLTADVTAKLSASGSGDVTILGKAACQVDNRGTGRISCGGEAY
ncbi:GIN domain-containing protein [Sphingobium mellinum]|uniref:GIN domain-containing protein n=1 Tax=Sphingobium mellinum TaxID=1387166 RepID=UPI0030EF4C0C